MFRDKIGRFKSTQFTMKKRYKLVLVLAVIGLCTLGVKQLQRDVEYAVTNYVYGQDFGSTEANAEILHALKAQSR